MPNRVAMALPIDLPDTIYIDTMTLKRDSEIAIFDGAAESNLAHGMTGWLFIPIYK